MRNKQIFEEQKVFIIQYAVTTTMTASSQTKYLSILILVCIVLLQTATAELTTQRENDADAAITLVDVSIGSSEEESACIFKVNGHTVVVNRHQTETYDGVTIYVQEVRTVNTEAENQDRCEFLYSIAGKTTEKDSAVQQEVINGETVNFLLGTRADLETQAGEASDETSATETQLVGEVINDNTVVKINGYDVTGVDMRTSAEEEIETSTKETTKSSDEIGIISKIFRFLFG